MYVLGSQISAGVPILSWIRYAGTLWSESLHSVGAATSDAHGILITQISACPEVCSMRVCVWMRVG